MNSQATNKLRDKVHKDFDALWKNNSQRTWAYQKLSRLMQITEDECHFTQFKTIKQLRHAEKCVYRMHNPTKQINRTKKGKVVSEYLPQEDMREALRGLGKVECKTVWGRLKRIFI